MKPVLVLGLVAVAVAATFFVLLEPVDPADPGEPGLGPRISLDEPTGPGRTTEIEGPGFDAETARVEAAVGGTRSVLDGQGDIEGSYDNAVQGVILDDLEQPLADVQVTLLKHKLGAQFAPIEAVLATREGRQRESWSTRSGSDGTFRFASLKPGLDYTLVAEHAEFSRTERSNFKVEAEGEVVVVLKMRTGYVLRGTVMDDQTGLPLADARLKLQSVFALLPGANQDDGLATASDADGRYEFRNVPAGTQNLTVTADGYGSMTRNNLNFSGSPLDPQTMDFRLSEGLRMRGRVTGPDLAPVAGALVEATSYETAQVSRGKAVTDADGWFEITDLAEGTFMVITRAQGYSDDRQTRVKLPGPDLQVTMSRQGGVLGTVVSRADGTPVRAFRAQVRAMAPGSTVYGRTVSQGNFDDPEGRFELGGLEPGTYVVQAEADGFAPTYSDSFVVSQGIVTADVRVELGQGGGLSGRIVDNRTGEPVAGAKVSTFDNGYVPNPFSEMLGGLVPRTTTDRKVRTDAEGRFEIEKLTAATYQLQVEHTDYPNRILKDLQVREGQVNDLGSIRLVKGAVIRGVVYDAAGAPLSNARINLTTNQPGVLYPGTIRSDAEGRFVVPNVDPGPWTLSAVRPESESAGNPFGPIIDMKKSEVQVMVSSGQEVTQNLTIGD